MDDGEVMDDARDLALDTYFFSCGEITVEGARRDYCYLRTRQDGIVFSFFGIVVIKLL